MKLRCDFSSRSEKEEAVSRIEEFFSRALKLQHLRLLVLLGQWGQLRIVAQRLGVSPPAVSRQLAELEAGLGVAVVRRVGNGLVFTDLGLVLLDRAREVTFQLEQAQQELSALSSGLRGEVCIGAVPSVMQQLAEPLTLSLRKRAPAVGVNLVEETSDKLYSLLCNGTLHLLFSRVVPPHFADGSIAGEVLFEDPLVIVCGTTHPLAGKLDVQPQDLAGHPWILPSNGSPAFQALNAWMHAHQQSFAEGSVRTSSTVYSALISSGNLLGLMSLRAAARAQTAGRIVMLELPDARFLSSVWMFHNPSEATSVLRIAVDCARQLVETFAAVNEIGN